MSNNPINRIAGAQALISALVNEFAGIEIDCDEQAQEAISAIRQASRIALDAEAAAKELASERRRMVDEAERLAKGVAKEAKALDAGTRQLLVEYIRKREADAKLAAEARFAMAQAERARLIAEGNEVLANLIPDPQPMETDIEGLSMGVRRALAISDPRAICQAILDGSMPAEALALNEQVVRDMIQSGRTLHGIAITETPYITIRDNEK